MAAGSLDIRALRPQDGVEDEKRNEHDPGRGVRLHWRPRLSGGLQALTMSQQRGQGGPVCVGILCHRPLRTLYHLGVLMSAFDKGIKKGIQREQVGVE